ncbi:MAG: BamA/TamA family outer membrane protein [Prevotella sp.]|nr:BamA/TamA family outer membrane protein [Prevotella sp.]
MKRRNDIILPLLLALVCAGCSTTSNLPEGEVLYTGLSKIEYTDPGSDGHSVAMQEEVEAALACAPNGALLGSSYYRTPFQLKLWIYNKYANSTSAFGKWMLKSFGREPVLMSYVNPEVRALVARNVLRSNGYFDAKVDYKVIPQKNPRKAKLSYVVTKNRLYTFDTIQYAGYAPAMDSIVRATERQSFLKRGEAFTVAKLDAERNRLNSVFRDSGYYYYRAAHTALLADSVSNPGTVAVRLQPVADMPAEAQHEWYLGRLRVEMRRSVMEQLTDSLVHRNLSVYYSGKKPPIRLRALLRDIKLRRGNRYSYSDYMESAGIINSLGLFSLSDVTFTPRDTTAACDTLDMRLNCVFDKPYDGSIEANYSLKSNDRTGPGLVLSMNKRNAFRGAEKLSVSLKGSYEWQTGGRVSGSSSAINSYEYGADVSIEYPRIETPFRMFRRRRFYTPPSTLFSLSGNVLNRADYFKMLTVTGAVTYKFQTSANSRHEFSPLLLDYNYLQSTTSRFDSIMTDNPAVYVSMRNQFVPKIKYTYIYSSPSGYRNPIAWELSLTESGNILSAIYAAAGKSFSEKEKGLFGNPFAQFLKLNTTLRKTWQIGYKSQLVGRVAAGVLWAYGNSERGPYNEQFYVGGANSIRAFTVRSIGPGKYVAPNSNYSYLDQTGDVKFEANLEYRFNMFGSLYGAVFLDAGNIWLLKDDPSRPDSEFKPTTFFRQLATGTGAGLRYDMDFIVLRLDLGVALHVPYDTGKGGYYNIPKFKDGLGLHFAIGYPF